MIAQTIRIRGDYPRPLPFRFKPLRVDPLVDFFARQEREAREQLEAERQGKAMIQNGARAWADAMVARMLYEGGKA